MPSQIRILNIHATGKEKSLTALFSKKKLLNIKIAEVYYISPELPIHQHATVSQLLSNPISQKNININNIIDTLKQFGRFKWVIEVQYLPGVTDNIGRTAEEIIKDNLRSIKKTFSVNIALLYFLDTKDKHVIDVVASEQSNPLIHNINILSFKSFIKKLRFKNTTDRRIQLSKKKYQI